MAKTAAHDARAPRRRTRRPGPRGRRARRAAHPVGHASGALPGLSLGLSSDVVRSLVGLFLLGLGAVTLIALLLPGPGEPHRLVARHRGAVRRLRALAAAVRAAARRLVRGVGTGQGGRGARGAARCSGIGMAYVGLLGLLQLTACPTVRDGDVITGGRIGRFLVELLRAAAHRARGVRRARGPARRGPADRVRPAAALDARPGHGPRQGRRLDAHGPDARRRAEAAAASAAGGPARGGRRRVDAAAGPTPAENGRAAARRGSRARTPGPDRAFGERRDVPQPMPGAAAGPMSATFAPARTPAPSRA